MSYLICSIHIVKKCIQNILQTQYKIRFTTLFICDRMQPYYEMESKQKEDFFMPAAQRALQETRSSSKRTGQDRTGQDRAVS